MTIKGNYVIEKRNVLNEIRANNMTLQELRFFSIYLSKINARDVNTRLVKFSIADFMRIMDFTWHEDLVNIRHVIDGLLCKTAHIPDEVGGIIGFQLFKKCVVSKDERGEWYVEIDAHDNALPLMFNFKERYFTYQLWNALKLKSSNQLRMYEILKQYEKTGTRVISIDELRKLLGIGENEYRRFGNFRVRVLDVCQKALEENTDIKFTYEPTGKLGNGGKVLSLKFIITKNENYKDQLSLEDFIDMQPEPDIINTDYEECNNDKEMAEESEKHFNIILEFLSEACKNEFNFLEMKILYDSAIQVIPRKVGAKDWELELYGYFKRKYNELELRASRTEIKHRFRYLKKIIDVEIEV